MAQLGLFGDPIAPAKAPAPLPAASVIQAASVEGEGGRVPDETPGEAAAAAATSPGSSVDSGVPA
ncbi:MAG TPA: hypothetical protein VIU64_17900, partial [Polyangia bacterium]